VRLEGAPARIQSSQLDVSAPVIALDIRSSAITQVRAQNGVSFRLNLPARGDEPAVSIQAKARTAVLDAAPRDGRRTLKLTGDVSGFYGLGAARNELSGESVTLSFGTGQARALAVQVEGGARGVLITLPSQNFGEQSKTVGSVQLRSTRASVDEKSGRVRFEGNARLTSTGSSALNISAPSLVASLSGQGDQRQLSTIQSEGRVRISLNIPPEALDKEKDATAPAAGNAVSDSGSSGLRPTRFEVEADSATIQIDTQQLLLKGNVRGAYTLAPEPGAANAAPQPYPFAGDQATVRLVPREQATAELPEGFNLEVTGRPVSVDLPSLDLGLD
jgi:hypothetical protein